MKWCGTQVLALVLSAISIVPGTAAAEELSADARFESTARAYIDKLLAMRPEMATWLGDHRFDDRLNDYTLEGVERSRALSREYLKELQAIPVESLNRTNGVDYRILRKRIEYALFRDDELREEEWNPLHYNIANAIYQLLARDYAPLEVRLKNVAARLDQVPAVIAAAKANLKHPPRVHTETAILQNKGTIALVRGEVSAEAAKAPELKPLVEKSQAKALAALEDYGQWLEKDLLPRSDGDFRLGDAKFRRKLAFDLDADFTKEEILRRAQADLERTQGELYKAALPLYKKYFPDEKDPEKLANAHAVTKAVLDKLAQAHPTNDTIVPFASETLARATRFVREHKLVSVPDDPVKVVVMPEFDRGVAVAYCRAAPPLEPKAQTLYAISPTPADWKPARVESFFREYNDYMVEDLTIHEAMPGHYLQLIHANAFKAPTLVRTIFRSGPFVEGWAVYAEQVMADSGYGGPEVRMQQLKMRARSIINAIMDQKIHTAGMTEQEAMKIMMEEGFQEEGEAAGIWRRAMLSAGQLSTYYVGLLGMLDIRRSYEARAKGPVDYLKLHDAMLSFGAPPPKYVKELLGLAP
ncbi:MAG: DUF885 domain-containing protein [Bacillota bacterium]